MLSDDGESYEVSSDESNLSLTSDEKLKLKSIIARLFGSNNYDTDRNQFNSMLKESKEEKDERPNYEEGIFFVPQKSLKQMITCQKVKK